MYCLFFVSLLFLSGPRAAILHRTSLLVDLICSLESVLHTHTHAHTHTEADADTDGDSKAVKITYCSSIYSFTSRAAMTIFDYITEECKEFSGNTVYIIKIAVPTLCVVMARKIVSVFYRSEPVRGSNIVTLETPVVCNNTATTLPHSHSSLSSPSPSLPSLSSPLSSAVVQGQTSLSSSSSSSFSSSSIPPSSPPFKDPSMHLIYDNENKSQHKSSHSRGPSSVHQSTTTQTQQANSNNQSESQTTSSLPSSPHTFSTLTNSDVEVLEKIRDKYKELLSTYAQAMKISLSVTITSFFLLLPGLRTVYPNSFWAILVVILIRQDNTSSSFLTGYQRLEGTVIGAVYSFTMYQIFGCEKNICGLEISTPVLVIWLAFCAFFRDGPRHGYAALVAGFTPIVLFLGNTPSTAEGAWQRVEETWIGVGVYLLIDNLILPNRTDEALREGVLLCIAETRYPHTITYTHFFTCIITLFYSIYVCYLTVLLYYCTDFSFFCSVFVFLGLLCVRAWRP